MNDMQTLEERFLILRGYFDGKTFHSQGKIGISIEEILSLLKFQNIADFKKWYSDLTQEELSNGKKDWCSGDCCQSIVRGLLEIS